jgi:hypothetical protein
LPSVHIIEAIDVIRGLPLSIIWRNRHDQGTKKQQRTKEETSHDPKRKEGCEKIQKGA